MTGTPPLRAAHRYSTSLKVDFLHPQRAASGAAVSISTTGMFVRTDAPFERGAVVDLALEFPDGDPPAPARAKVVYVAAQSTAPGLGMQFVDTGQLRPRVDRHIDSILRHGNVTALRVLTSARDLLRQDGWTQLERENEDRRFCLSGALRHAAGGDRRAYQEALRAIGSRLGLSPCAYGGFSCHCPVIRWNDAEGRTHHQVIAKVDEAIDAELHPRTAA